MYFVPHPLPRPLVTIATNRMDDILQKLQRLMKEDKIVILEFPVCEELQISLLRWVWLHVGVVLHVLYVLYLCY